LSRLCVVLALLAGLVSLAPPVLAQRADADLACGQEPGSRFFWVERAFCDLPTSGPSRAHGVVIWNHGISGTNPSWRAPAPPAFRLLQARGWDVLVLKRHNLAETMPGGPLARSVERTLQEAAAQRKLGYGKVVLAGQSFGGYVALEAIDSAPDLFAAVAFAPGMRSSNAAGRFDPTTIEQILQRARVGRLALVFPKHDALLGAVARGERAQPILERRELPYLMIDETSDVSGHGGGVTGRFALRYGFCLVEFLAAAALPSGRFACPPPEDGWTVVRELLMPAGARRPDLADRSTLPASVASPAGPHWALLGDTLVLAAPVTDPRGLRLLYRSTTSRGGVFDATITNHSIQAAISGKSTVTLSAEAGGTITLTSPDAAPISAPLRPGD
jgi:pimeloyl-ACP methyl ester carboxylesterase